MTQNRSRLASRLCLLAIPLFGAVLLSGFSSRTAPERRTATLRADSVTAPTPDSLAALFLNRFVSGTAEEFASVDPDSESRKVMQAALKKGLPRERNVGRVVERGPKRAVLLLTGTVKTGDGGDRTNLVRHFSGFYEAVESGGGWRITQQLPFDTLNYIRSQTLHAEIDPGHGIHVLDTLSVGVGVPYGIGFRLNSDVKLKSVKLDGDSAAYEFGGGVLWLNAPIRKKASIVLDYTLNTQQEASHDTTGKAAAPVAPPAGAFHNTDVWAPFFGYNSSNDVAHFAITATIPAKYYLTTTLPQTESVANGIRTVVGRSGDAQFLISAIYDSDWRPKTSNVDGVRFETFTSPDFHFSHDTLAKALRAVDKILGARFGGPVPPYVAVVEDRALGKRGFSVHMGNAVVSGTNPTQLEELGVRGPTSAYAHEISHGWTMNASGPAANMLREGWASFSEYVVLGAEHGPAVAQAFMERARNGYMLGSEGRLSILGNPDNGGVHYSKGCWIFYMFDKLIGDKAFDRAMREFAHLQSTGQPAGYEELIAAMSRAAGRDLHSFAMPWFTEKVIPDVRAQISGGDVILTQEQATAPFDLPLEVELITSSGKTSRRTVRLMRRADTLHVGTGDPVTAVHVDPDRRLLLRRYWGEVVTLELPVAQTTGAKTVALVGDFSLGAVPATRAGDKWVVTLPLSEGRYVWSWQIDGKPRSEGEGGDPGTQGDPSTTGERVVRPLQLLTDPYPKL
jgi:hypothetical protein